MNRDVLEEKDMFKLFNYISIDDKDDEDINLKMDNLRKKRLIKNLMKQVKGKDSVKKFKYKAAAVAVIAIISICASMPALANNVPAIKSIIQALNGSIGSDSGEYEKYSKVLNKSVTDNGITLIINEVLCDDSSLMIGYTIKSEGNIKKIVKSGKDIIEMQEKDGKFMPFSLIRSLKIDGKPANSSSGGGGKYLDDHTYINSETLDIGNKNLPSVFNVDLDVKNIYEAKGNWSFKFSVSKDEILKNTKVFKLNTTVKFPYGAINVEKVSFTPINTSIKTTIKYNKDYINSRKLEKEGGDFNWFVFDDKGNEITQKGCSENKIENSPSSDFENEFRFVSLKNVPKYLTVIPYRTNYNADYYKEYKTAGGGIFIPPTYKDINGVFPIELSQGKMDKLIIKEIKTEKDKTVVKYTAEGQAPFYQAKYLYILDEKDEEVKRKDNNFETKRDGNNSNDYIIEFEPLDKDKNKKYKIGTNDLGGLEIRNDLKFTIDLSNK